MSAESNGQEDFLDDIDNDVASAQNRTADIHIRKCFEPWNFGAPKEACTECGAILWYEERSVKNKRQLHTTSQICCENGRVRLPLLRDAPDYLKNPLDYYGSPQAIHFRENIRVYNIIFAFTSMGGTIDNTINDGRGPYVYRICGQNYHKIGSLLPPNGQLARFAQLYIYDTENEVQNRMNMIRTGRNRALDPEIVNQLLRMLDAHNQLAKAFRMARDRFKESDYANVHLRLIRARTSDGRVHNLTSGSEVAGLIEANGEEFGFTRDIIVDERGVGLKRITESHPSFMAMQYPLLFPYGEDGFRLGILHADAEVTTRKNRTVTPREYYAFRLHFRPNEGHTLHCGGRLFQQYIVDAFTCIQESRFQFLRKNHKKFRTHVLCGLQDAVVRGDTSGDALGKRIILPSSFTGGPRNMVQNYQDAMAICRWAGSPDYFITMTCNPKWPEIQEFFNLIPGQRPDDRPDIVSRVFKIKLNQLLKDLTKGKHFGRAIAIYTIEFQKRGLPHAHIALFIHPDDKPKDGYDVDKFISAQLPDKDKDPIAYSAVVKHAMHGPCGNANVRCPCMVNGKCSKYYPRSFQPETTLSEDGFPIYKRRDNGRTTWVNVVELDNTWVVLHNVDLLVKYDCHINVECCNQQRCIKYLFKYMCKGEDRAICLVQENMSTSTENGQHVFNDVDENKRYTECRYVSASEASWRIFEFPIQYREPAVERLSFHLENEQNIIYDDDDDDIDDVLSRQSVYNTMFIEWMKTNAQFEDARSLTYVDFPTKWVWNKKIKKWMLLNVQRGPTSFDDLRTVNGITHATFKEACKALGLLEGDSEWHETLKEAAQWKSGRELRELFVTILLFSEVSDPAELWATNWNLFSDDVLFQQRSALGRPDLPMSDQQLQEYTLYEIEKIMNKCGRSLKEFKTLPFPTNVLMDDERNSLIREELMRYDRNALSQEHNQLSDDLNVDQLAVYNAVLQAVDNGVGGFFFVHGSGGTGKTYLWKTIIARLRSQGKIVLAVASSGIAALLLPGGRTAHSMFKIPIKLDNNCCCNIRLDSPLSDLIASASLILWDEAPMTHRHAFEALNRTLRDIMKVEDKPFGGKTVVLGGDFRQILPVVPQGSKGDIIAASICRSLIWDHCRVFTLSTNMRLRNATSNSTSEFSQWLLNLGEGRLSSFARNEDEELTWIDIPKEFLIPRGDDPISDIVDSIFPELLTRYSEAEYLKDRAILSPTNEIVDKVNRFILEKLPGSKKTYYSADQIAPESSNFADQTVLYPIEFLNTLTFPGVPNHEIELKEGIPIILLRNINQSLGLCNGTRLIVKRLGDKVIEAVAITGISAGRSFFIPRVQMTPTDSKWPFVMTRRQFPVKVSLSMTMNKAQGQTYEKVGVYLPKPVFTHGQLYVAASRVTSPDGLKFLLDNEDLEMSSKTKNVVYSEIFNDLSGH